VRSDIPMLFWLVAVLTVLAAASGPATQPVQTASAWGPEVNGLRARLNAPAEIEQNVALSVSIELRCDPASLPPGIARFGRSYPNKRLRLALTNAATGRVVELKPFDLHLLLASDVHENTEPLDGRPLEPIRASFLLRSARDALTPGAYDCTLSYSDPGPVSQVTQGGSLEAARPRPAGRTRSMTGMSLRMRRRPAGRPSTPSRSSPPATRLITSGCLRRTATTIRRSGKNNSSSGRNRCRSSTGDTPFAHDDPPPVHLLFRAVTACVRRHGGAVGAERLGLRYLRARLCTALAVAGPHTFSHRRICPGAAAADRDGLRGRFRQSGSRHARRFAAMAVAAFSGTRGRRTGARP
jgi:hypothetical protein